jgi:pimeloyl-ACP methyl ester carboxylesterase
MTRTSWGSVLLAWLLMAMAMAMAGVATAATPSRIVSSQIVSRSLAESSIGTSPNRKINVYLPAGYDESQGRFPVIYFLSGFFEDETAPFTTHGAKAVLDAAIASGAIGKVIVVTADFTTPVGGSWYVNSSATGNWEDFMVRDLVPFIDAGYRTLAERDSRGIVGDRMGGYGALRLGMRHPDVFAAVYALHPIGIGPGVQPMSSRPNWALLQRARSLEDLESDGFSQIFTSIYQAHLPNPARPPLYFDPPARREGDRLVIDPALTERLANNFFLDRQVGRYAANLRRLNGLKFDWARNDTVTDHIVSLQAFTHTLDEFGLPYEAEEYRGGWGDRHWGADGRMVSDVLPFFRSRLAFAR